MLRWTLAFVLAATTAAAAKPAVREPVRREEIPPGTEWWCYVSSVTGLASCLRSEDQCHEVQRAMGQVIEEVGRRARGAGVEAPSGETSACTLTASVWVRTGRFGDRWDHVIAPSKALCERAPNWDLGVYDHDSGCRRWHEREPPPDAAVVPAGKGWSCYAATVTGVPTTICARTRRWCEVAYRISHGDGSAPACKAARRAFVFTTAGEFHAFGDAAACEAVRDDDATASTCAAQ